MCKNPLTASIFSSETSVVTESPTIMSVCQISVWVLKRDGWLHFKVAFGRLTVCLSASVESALTRDGTLARDVFTFLHLLWEKLLISVSLLEYIESESRCQSPLSLVPSLSNMVFLTLLKLSTVSHDLHQQVEWMFNFLFFFALRTLCHVGLNVGLNVFYFFKTQRSQ